MIKISIILIVVILNLYGIDTDNDGYENSIEILIGTDENSSQSKPNSPPDINNDGSYDLLFYSLIEEKIYYYNLTQNANLYKNGVFNTMLNTLNFISMAKINNSWKAIGKRENSVTFYSKENGIESTYNIPNVIGVWDYNQDNNSDLISWNKDTNKIEIYLYENNTYDTQLDFSFTINDNLINFEPVGIGDLVQDGEIDILFYDNSNNTYYSMNIDNSYHILNIFIPQGFTFSSIGDYSRDGQDDLIFYNIEGEEFSPLIRMVTIKGIENNTIVASNIKYVDVLEEQIIYPMGINTYENDFEGEDINNSTVLYLDREYKSIISSNDTDVYKIILDKPAKLNIYSAVENNVSGVDLFAKLTGNGIWIMSSDADMSNNINFQIVTKAPLPAGEYELTVSNENQEIVQPIQNGYYILYIKESFGCDALDNPDQDNDGICQNEDNAPEYYNPDQNDSDGDDFGDCLEEQGTCDSIIFDGPAADPDNDGIYNYKDLDDDNDGLSDITESNYYSNLEYSQCINHINDPFLPYHKNNLNLDHDCDGYPTNIEMSMNQSPYIEYNKEYSIGKIVNTHINYKIINDTKVGEKLKIIIDYNIDINPNSVRFNFDKDVDSTLINKKLYMSGPQRVIGEYDIIDSDKIINNVTLNVTANDLYGFSINSIYSNFRINTKNSGISPAIINYILN